MATDLHTFLDSANLLGYKNALLEQGADDLQQLKDLSDAEFRQLCEMVGMDTKPFHMMRFRKTLERYPSAGTTTNQPQHTPPPPPVSSGSTSSPSVLPPHPSLPPSISTPSPILQINSFASSHSCPLDTVGLASISPPILGSPPLEIDAVLEGKLFLPPYLQPGSECRSFDDLIDDQTPIQRQLGPCPFTPKIWDDKRKQIIRKYSTIYGKNADKRRMELSDFEVNINEASYQLCLRDPTLLARRDELFILAKRAITEGGYPYHHGFSKAKKCENSLFGGGGGGGGACGSEKKHRLEVDESSLEGAKSLKLDKLITDSMTKLHKSISSAERLNESKRKQKMAEVGMKISTNKLHQSSKLAALEKAHEQGDHGTAYHIQMELEALGTDCMKLQGEYTLLKKKQRRSERYYNLKEKQEEEQQQHCQFESSPHDHHTRSSAEQDCSIPSESNLTKQVVDIMHTPANSRFDSSTKAALLSTAFVGSQHRERHQRKSPNAERRKRTANEHQLALEFEREKVPIFPQQQFPKRSRQNATSPIRTRPTVTATILPKPAPTTTQQQQQQQPMTVQASSHDNRPISSLHHHTPVAQSQSSHAQNQSLTFSERLVALKQQQQQQQGQGHVQHNGGSGGMGSDGRSSSASMSSDDNIHAVMIEDFKKQLNWNLK